MTDVKTDVLIIGGGIAGLSLALHLCDLQPELSISIITKEEIEEANTKYAQGGISSVLSVKDSFDSHVQDTMVAGAGLCRKDVVEEMVKHGPEAINQLMEWGVEFDHGPGDSLELGMEGGHKARRVAHVKDFTGLADRGCHLPRPR